MAWQRSGQLYVPPGDLTWAQSHAALPTPVHIDADCYRFFFSARDAGNRSSISWVDVDLAGSPKIVAEARAPALSFGTPGMFDDSGVSIGSIVLDGAEARLYYMGWNLGVTAPWRNSIGVAVGDVRQARFERMYAGPILDRSPWDPFTLSYPWVLRVGPRDWRMWYGSNTKWGASSADMHHVLKVASSDDGLTWSGQQPLVMRPEMPGEYAFARPTVIHDRGMFRMWFAVRGDRYRIGYAESRDGVTWTRDDRTFGLAPGAAGWDSEMTCYPCAFAHKGRLYLAYNGNAYGRTGFGLAVWDEAGA